jgi:site-specific DNA-cytosine methylase
MTIDNYFLLAIDIVIGGPPCADYCKINALRQGYQGVQGQYIIRFGRLIRRIEQLQHPRPIFFVAENVFVTGDDRRQIMEAFKFDWDPISLDAQYLSPTRRNRHFITNIPINDLDFTAESSMIGPESCLEKGFFVPAHLVDPEVTAKVRNCNTWKLK